MSIASSTKRKRDDSDDGSAEANPHPTTTSGDIKSTAAIKGAAQAARDQKLLIHDYFAVLRRYALPITHVLGPLLRSLSVP
jgi:hypothetical protein